MDGVFRGQRYAKKSSSLARRCFIYGTFWSFWPLYTMPFMFLSQYSLTTLLMTSSTCLTSSPSWFTSSTSWSKPTQLCPTRMELRVPCRLTCRRFWSCMQKMVLCLIYCPRYREIIWAFRWARRAGRFSGSGLPACSKHIGFSGWFTT